MAKYPNTKLTDAGLSLQQRSITEKKPIVFTSINIGNGDISGYNVSVLTKLVNQKMILPIIDVKKANASGQYTITAALSNKEVNEDFWSKEVGVFAKLDGDDTPILYSYSNAGEKGFLVPSKETPLESQIYRVDVRISNSANVTIIINDTVYITRKELDAHNKDENAHPPILEKIKKHRELEILDHPDKSVTHEKLADNSVYGSVLKRESVTWDKIADGAVSGQKMTPSCVQSRHIVTGNVLPKHLDRTYLEVNKVDIPNSRPVYDVINPIRITGWLDCGGKDVVNVLTPTGKRKADAVNVQYLENNTVTSFDGLKGNVDFYNYLSRYRGMNIDKMTPKEIASKGFFWNYYQSENSGVKTLPYASAVLSIRDSVDGGGRDDSWEIAFCHNGGRGAENLRIRHVTGFYSKCEDIPWVEIITRKYLTDALNDVAVIEKRVYDD